MHDLYALDVTISHNNINFINNSQGDHLDVHEDIENELKEYFQNILREPLGIRNQAIQSITRHIPKIIMDDHNVMLLHPITLHEVEKAME